MPIHAKTFADQPPCAEPAAIGPHPSGTEPERRGSYRFPWRDGNHFGLLIDGRSFYAAMLDAIAGARCYILLEMYLFESGQVADRFIDALVASAARGVRVHLLLDDFGCLHLRGRDRQRLTEAGIEVVWFNPISPRRWYRLFLRDHRKLLLVDGAVAFTGGAGISDPFDPDCGDDFWHELMLEIRGPLVADWHALFASAWRRWAQGPDTLPHPPEPQSLTQPAGQGGRVAVHGGPRRSEIMRSHLHRIRLARQRVWVATAYFLPSWKLRRTLRRRARAGIDVRLLLPGPRTDHPSVRAAGQRHYERLLRSGVRIFEYQPRFLHAKVSVCDDWLSIGSSNLDRWNNRWNLEANQEFADPQILAQLLELFEADFACSEEILHSQWVQRPWHRRGGERLLARVEQLLFALGNWLRHRFGVGQPPG
jgi:cardiolipin synthase A/B